MTFESFSPTEEEVKEVFDIIKSKYKVKEDTIEFEKGNPEKVKYVSIRDKMHYLTGRMVNKARLRKVLSVDLKNILDKDFSAGAINRAIKDFIDAMSA